MNSKFLLFVVAGLFAFSGTLLISNLAYGETLAIGEIQKKVDGVEGVGVVNIFDVSTGSLIKTINNPEGNVSGSFGTSILYHNDKIIISAPGQSNEHNQSKGAVYVLDGETWSHLVTMKNPEQNGSSEFGISVAAVGGKLIVGSPQQSINGVFGAGAVHIFDIDTGSLIQTISDPNPSEFANFGNSVTALDKKFAVGIPGLDVNNKDRIGAVLIFDIDTGSLIQTISNLEPDSREQFGYHITSEENLLLIGAPSRNIDGHNSAGAVYLFDGKTGSLLHVIHNPEPDDNTHFGISLLIAENKIMVGANRAGLFNAGVVYVFDKDSGKLLETINHPDRDGKRSHGSNDFGHSLAYSSGSLVIGDGAKTIDGKASAGTVYVFDSVKYSLLKTIPNPNPDMFASDLFGRSVAFVGDFTHSEISEIHESSNKIIGQNKEISAYLDRDIYPVPFGSIGDFEDVETFHPDGRSLFPVHLTAITPDKMQEEHTLGAGDLTLYIRIHDPNFDVSPQEIDIIAQDIDDTNVGPLKISVSRDSQTMVLAYAGGSTPNENGLIDVGDDNPENARQLGPISELAPDVGLFELDFTVRYTDGPSNPRCPVTAVFASLNSEMLQGNEGSRFDAGSPEKEDYCIMKGDVLTVEYARLDASGNVIEVLTDSATFNLRDASLKLHDSFYHVGSDIILTLTEPDLNLDKDEIEIYSLDLVEWDSDAAVLTMGDLGGETAAFDSLKPHAFQETGDHTGVFQAVAKIPLVLQDNKLERGEEIILEYTDWSPSSAQYVGQEDKDVNWTIRTSEKTGLENTGTIEWLYEDGADYSPGGHGIIKLIDPTLNSNPELIDITTAYAWSTPDYPRILIDMVETGPDTGIFYGDIGFTDNKDISSSLKVSRGISVTVSYDGAISSDSSIIVAKKPVLLPPLQQIKQGTPVKEVSCMDNKQHNLFIKDGTKPLCLKQETYDVLVLRGYF